MNNDKENLGNRLQIFRKREQITQQEMAEACGLTKNHISALERGCNTCNAQTLIEYAKKLHVSIDELAGIAAKDTRHTEILPELYDVLSKMDFQQQRQILNVIRALNQPV